MKASQRLKQQIDFIVEIDKLKNVLRQTLLTDGSRRENDAEHSWHLAVMAMVLGEYAPEGTDICHAIKLVLVHDLVELYAGDTFAYDDKGHEDKDARERKAAERLFGLLPDDQGQLFRSLWEEYEKQDTKESQFALALDRLQPLLHNYHTNGGTWKKFDVPGHRVLHRAKSIAQASDVLGQFAEDLIRDSIKKGLLKE